MFKSAAAPFYVGAMLNIAGGVLAWLFFVIAGASQAPFLIILSFICGLGSLAGWFMILRGIYYALQKIDALTPSGPRP